MRSSLRIEERHRPGRRPTEDPPLDDPICVSSLWGPVRTPTADRLANEGLRYTRFHTTSLCAPISRSLLLTGRNHHSVGMGAVTEVATFAGVQPVRPKSAAYRLRKS
jgi:arylsulfatase A-like enzyme